VLRRHGDALRVTDFELAAQQFLSLVVYHSLCLATLGIKEDRRSVEARVRSAVDLFLNGATRPSFRSCSRRRG
jgi:hypothetical protein